MIDPVPHNMRPEHRQSEREQIAAQIAAWEAENGPIKTEPVRKGPPPSKKTLRQRQAAFTIRRKR